MLALALAIEAAGFRERLQSDSVGRATALITLLLLAYGEFEALEGLADAEQDGNDAELVWAALTAGALGIVLVALRTGPAKSDP